MATFYNWSTTPASNASVGNIDWAEGMAPSQVNNSARQEMADVAAWRDFFGGAKTTSGTDTITLTSGMTITAYASNQLFVAKLGGTNTGAATLNIDSLGAKAVEINGSAVTAGELVAGKFYMFVYDGTAFQASRVSAASGFTNPMTTQGDMIRGGASGVAERVAIGAANTVLISDATDADWSKLPIASIADGTDGELITWDAAGAPAVVAVGTSGQILTSGGAGVAPTFATPAAGGAWEFVDTTSAAGATTYSLLEGNVSSGYDYMIVMTNFKFSADLSPKYPRIEYGSGAGPTYQTSGYKNNNAVFSNAATLNANDQVTSAHPLAAPGTYRIGGTIAGEYFNCEIMFYDPAANDITHMRSHNTSTDSTGNSHQGFVSGHRTTADICTGFRIYIDGAKTMTSGTFTTYRRKRTA